MRRSFHRRLGSAVRLVASAAAVLLAAHLAHAAEPIEYPPTLAKPVVETFHGVEVTDNYRWLEADTAWPVCLWTQRQNMLTRKTLDAIPERERILKRLREFAAAPRVSIPYRAYGRDDYVQWRREGLVEHAGLYIREKDYRAKPRLALDPNTWDDADKVLCEYVDPSPDGRYLAYTKRERNAFNLTVCVRDLETGEDLPDQIPYASSWVLWDRDATGFYCVHWCLFHDAKGTRGTRRGWDGYGVCHHVLGTDFKDDTVIFGRDNPERHMITIAQGRRGRYLFIFKWPDRSKTDVYYVDLDSDEPEVTPLAVGLDARFGVAAVDDAFVIYTDWKAPLGCFYRCRADDPARENWEQIVPEQKGPIVHWWLAGRRLFVEVLEDMEVHLLVHSVEGKFLGKVPLPAIGSIDSGWGSADGRDFFFRFTSYLQPRTPYHYDTARGTLKRLERTGPDFDFGRYVTRKVWYTSSDGTPVPMLLVHRKGLKRNGRNPVLLYGYGGFNIVMEPAFDASLLVWLEAGGVYAAPNLRGGGELGTMWHEAGKGAQKQNTFDDFIAAAEYLIAEGYTNPGRLAIGGGSNGGLLVAAAMTQRPDLFRAVVCEVPILDMVRYHKMRGSNAGDLEYGTAENPDEFRDLLAYSPYHCVKAGVTYPAVFIRAGAQDPVVGAAHARKMAALLQSVAADDRPALLWVEPSGGHWWDDMTRAQRLETNADKLTWLMWQLGMIEGPEK